MRGSPTRVILHHLIVPHGKIPKMGFPCAKHQPTRMPVLMTRNCYKVQYENLAFVSIRSHLWHVSLKTESGPSLCQQVWKWRLPAPVFQSVRFAIFLFFSILQLEYTILPLFKQTPDRFADCVMVKDWVLAFVLPRCLSPPDCLLDM